MRLVCFACCAMICAVQAKAQTNKTLSLTLQQAVEMAVQHNLDVQIQRYVPLNDLYLVAEAQAVFEPAFNGSARRAWSETPGSVSSTGVVNFSTRADDSTFSFGIGNANGGLAETPWGLSYGLTSTIDKTTFRRFDTNGIPFLFDQGTTFAGITLQQALLKNAWIDQPRFQIELSKKNAKYDELGFRTTAINIIEQTEAAYYELIYNFENVKVQEMAVKLKQQLVNENVKRVEVGALAPLDERQSESQLASARADLLAAEQTVGTQQNVLKSLISDKYTDIYNVTLVPAEKLVAVPEQLDLQECWRIAVKNRPDLLQAKVDLERKALGIRYAKNQLFPELDVTGTYGRRGVEGTVDAALDDIQEGRFPSYSYGLVLSVPLGAQAQRAAYKSAKAADEQSRLIYKRTEQNVLIQVQNTVGNLGSAMEKIRSTREAREYAEQALEAEQRKLEVGKSTSFQVLQLQNDLTTARIAEIRALADYNQSLALLGSYMGTTLEKHRLTVKVK